MFINEHKYAFPIINAAHLLGLCALLGAALVIHLRALGVGLVDRPLARVAADGRPLVVGGLVTMVVTGLLLLASEAEHCFGSTPFRLKMALLAVAAPLHFAAVRAYRRDEAPRRAIAAASLVLWFAVALAGRAIGLL